MLCHGGMIMNRKYLITATLCMVMLTAAACHRDRNIDLGSAKNPIELGFMPSEDKEVMEKNAAVIASGLEKASGYKARPVIASNYFNLLEGLGTKKIDAAFMNSLGFLLAHDWNGAEAVVQLKGVDGGTDYISAIIVRSDSGIKKLSDLNGKSFVYSDPYSMAGYLMPLELLNANGIKPSKESFAGGYSDAIEMVYNGKADAAAIYYHKRDPYGRINDARARLVPKYNDLLEKVTVLDFTDTIPNTPVVFRKNLPADVGAKLTEAFLKLSSDPAVLLAIGNMYQATGFVEADQESFGKIRETLKKLGKEVKEVVPGGITFFQKHIWENVPEY